jgi:hypothetical protein
MTGGTDLPLIHYKGERKKKGKPLWIRTASGLSCGRTGVADRVEDALTALRSEAL